MNKITKETIKRIKEGYYDDLMDAMGFLVDSYNANKWDNGYNCCLDDVIMYSDDLAKHIIENTTFGGEDSKGEDFEFR